MSGEQVHLRSLLNCLDSIQLDHSDDRAVNSRLLVRRQKMHGFQRCYGEPAGLTVDDVWQNADVGN